MLTHQDQSGISAETHWILSHQGGAKAFAEVTVELLKKLEISLGMKEQTSRLSLVDLE